VYIWSKRLKDTSKNMYWLRFLDHPVYVNCVSQ